MNKVEFIEFVNNNNYEYFENPKEIHVDKWKEDGNIEECITYYKDSKEVQIWLTENGSGIGKILSYIEIQIIEYFLKIIENKNNKMEISGRIVEFNNENAINATDATLRHLKAQNN